MTESRQQTGDSQASDIEEQARVWVIKIDGGTLQPTDESRLQQWLSESQRHRDAFQSAQRAWGLVDDWVDSLGSEPPAVLLEGDSEPWQNEDWIVPDGVEFLDDGEWSALTPESQSTAESLSPGKSESPGESQPIGEAAGHITPVAKPWQGFGRLQRISAAAVLLLVVGVVFSLWPLPEGHYRTGKGEQLTQALADGSVVTLNTNSYLAVDFSDGERRIELRDGEAYFEVAHDPGRPFVVYAGEGQVRAVGTAFNVYAREESVAVTVTEGIVEVSAEPVATGNQPAKRVTVNQSLVYRNKLGLVTERDSAWVGKRLAWRQHKLYFDNTSLEAFVDQLNRYSPGRIMIMDPALRDLRVGGVFKAGDSASALAALEASFDVEPVRFTPYLTLLYKRSPQDQ